MTRSEFATVNFGRNNVSAGFPSIRSVANPPLTNSIIGGWATQNDRDLATNDELQGIVALGDRVARPDQIEGASINDHVRIRDEAPQTLTADRTIATLTVERSGTDTNLGGNTLTIRQGGLLIEGASSGSTSISQGQVTAGGSVDPSVLYLHAHSGRSGHNLDDVDIRASITDNQFGGAVTLVKSGPGEATLSGNNIYSGATVVQQGRVTFEAETSLPSGGELWVDSGTAILNYISSEPKRLSSFKLTQGGLIQLGVDGDNVELDADEYTIESGISTVPLAGMGVLRKTTRGTASLEVDSTNFHGDVIVEEGILLAGGNSVRAAPKALGNGLTSILPGGTLVHSSVLSGAGYMLLDADLNLAGGDVGLGVSIRTPRWDFAGNWDVTAPSRVLMFDYSGEDAISAPTGEMVDPNVSVLNSVSISAGAGLLILGEGEMNFTEGVEIAGNTFIDVADGAAVLNGFTSDSRGATLELRGRGVIGLPSNLINEGSGDLTLEVTPGATAELSRRGTAIGEGVTLALNGQSTGRSSFFLLDGGTLTGSSIPGSVENRSGILAPGDGIGEVYIDSVFQGPEGVLLLELLGGSIPSSDVIHLQNATLAGLLRLSVIEGTQVDPGDMFDLVIADSLNVEGLKLATDGFSGRLAIVNPATGANAGKTVLRLSVLVPEPGYASLLLLFCTFVFCRNRECSF